MASTSSTFAGIIAPEAVGDLIVKPLIEKSVAGQTLTPVSTNRSEFRIPILSSLVSASWAAEGSELSVTDADIDELVVTPSKLAAFTALSAELVADSSPAAAAVVGNAITWALADALDAALFSASTSNGPTGLPGTTGVSTVDAGTAYSNSDAFSDAIYESASHNGTITAFVTHPDTAKTLSKLKVGTDYNLPLLQPDATLPGKRQILGVPLLTSTHVATTDNDVWAIPKAQCFLVIREQAEVESDSSVYFSSHRVALRGIARVGIGIPNPPSVVKITTSAT